MNDFSSYSIGLALIEHHTLLDPPNRGVIINMICTVDISILYDHHDLWSVKLNK